MESKDVPNLNNLSPELLGYILGFFSQQERVEILQALRTACKSLNTIISSNNFLKSHAPVLHLKNQIKAQNLKEFLNTERVIDEQIQDWSNLKTKVDGVFDEFYTKLPQIQPVINLLNEIKNTPIPANYYFTALGNTLRPRQTRIGLVMVFLFVLAAVIVSSLEFPAIAPIKANRIKIEKELLAEGCTFQSQGRHGSIYISNCNDTKRADEWQDLQNQEFRHLLGPLVLDIVGGAIFIATIVAGISVYCRERQNQPTSYEDLMFANLTPSHQSKFTNIRNSFGDRNNNYVKIKEVSQALKEIITKKRLPTVIEEDIFALEEQYQTIISNLDAEIEKLEEYKTKNMLVLSTKLADGTLKTSFRSNVYSFFSKCKVITSPQQSHGLPDKKDDIELGLQSRRLKMATERTPLINK